MFDLNPQFKGGGGGGGLPPRQMGGVSPFKLEFTFFRGIFRDFFKNPGGSFFEYFDFVFKNFSYLKKNPRFKKPGKGGFPLKTLSIFSLFQRKAPPKKSPGLNITYGLGETKKKKNRTFSLSLFSYLLRRTHLKYCEG